MKIIFVSSLVAVLLFGLGCAGSVTAFGVRLSALEIVVVADDDLASGSGVRSMDKDGAVFVEEGVDENGEKFYRFGNNVLPRVDLDGVGRADYHKAEFSQNGFMVVQGQMSSGKVYPVVFDTGAGLRPVILQDIHIRDNDLGVFPFDGVQGLPMMLTAVDELVIGGLKLTNYPGICWGQHIESRLLGIIPVGRSRDISFPLLLMTQFRYFLFDNVNERAQFSRDVSFDAGREEGWWQFPLYLHWIDGGEQAVLFVEMEINGRVLRPMLDTGCGAGLVMNRNLWDKMEGRFEVVGRKSRRFILPLHFEGNSPKCASYKVNELELGDFSVASGEVAVLPEGKNWERADCILGMEYFRDRTVVVDFERGMLWVRKLDSQ
ncbi:MAG: hypothetical protein FVQ79_07395 [Planctomycetes bacterium]|nr:hypothetical protein [Planctomycetota bacterium]